MTHAFIIIVLTKIIASVIIRIVIKMIMVIIGMMKIIIMITPG